MGLSLADKKKAIEDAEVEEEGYCMVPEVSGVDKESNEGGIISKCGIKYGC